MLTQRTIYFSKFNVSNYSKFSAKWSFIILHSPKIYNTHTAFIIPQLSTYYVFRIHHCSCNASSVHIMYSEYNTIISNTTMSTY